LTLSVAIFARRTGSWKALIAARYPDVRWVDGETLAKWMGGSLRTELILLDVRTAEEQQVSHLRGARYVDPDDPDIGALGIGSDATVVVYCSIGYRSASIVDDLEEVGITDIYNLEGGLFQWANGGRPIFRGSERVHEVHPFNRIWALLLRKDLRASD
jgi:rhodanese-related sulfurtransferase